MPDASTFAGKVAAVAQAEYEKFRFMNEGDPELCRRIKQWTEEIGFPFQSCTAVPWASQFVSWCVKEAGATRADFEFSMTASAFAHTAIQHALAGLGGFRGFDVAAHAPHVGDIITHNRGGNRFDFAFAREHRSYASHPVIVVEIGVDADGPHAFVVGGNEGDTVRRTALPLGPDGLVRQRENNPFICILHPEM